MKTIILLLSALCLYACNRPLRAAEEPRTPTQVGIEDWRVKKVFEVEGCGVYEFKDRHAFDEPWRFITICPARASVSGVVPCGDKCTKVVEIETVRSP